MKMSNKTYDTLKWIAQYLLPAAGSLRKERREPRRRVRKNPREPRRQVRKNPREPRRQVRKNLRELQRQVRGELREPRRQARKERLWIWRRLRQQLWPMQVFLPPM